jgi:hypothetical protein
MDGQSLRESVTGAIRYWEPRRLAYNAALAAIVLIYFGLNYPTSRSALSMGSFGFSAGGASKRRLLRSISS